jgi:hypothetical protein
MRSQQLERLMGEQNSPMPVGLKVHTNAEALRGVMEVLHTRRGTFDRQAASKVFSRVAVGISGLHNADFNLACKAGALDHIGKIPGNKSRNLVAVKQTELPPVVDVVVDQPISIAIKATRALQDLQVFGDARRKPLLCLDKVCAGLVVERSFGVDCGIDRDKFDEVLDIGCELFDRQEANAIGTVYDERGRNLFICLKC